MEDIPQGQSPRPQPRTKALIGINFFDALKAVLEGKKITKMEWNNPRIYGALENGTLMLHKEDSLHTWVISDGDMKGEDWIVLAEDKRETN